MPKPAPVAGQEALPIQPVEKPILCNPYDEPTAHWVYERETGEAKKLEGRRRAGYWFKSGRVSGSQLALPTIEEEQFDELPVVNRLRGDVKRWRSLKYEGATPVTRQLLQHWTGEDRLRRLFFCQREAVETVIYLAELRLSGRRPRFTPECTDHDLEQLADDPGPAGAPALTRLGCKMATGSGKTVVMAMLIAWAFVNRGRNPADERFPDAALVCCPNLTIKERLQVLRPDHPSNYYEVFDLVPAALRPLLQRGKVLVTNWHLFSPESEHVEGGKSYLVVDKGPESPGAFSRRVLGDLADRAPLLVLNDEAPARPGKPKTRITYGAGKLFPEFFANTPDRRATLRIDTRLLAEAESESPSTGRKAAAEELRRIVATVGKLGEPGEHVRCVVSVAMLTEGWDANNVTHILGIRAFGSQLLCEQVIGRGLRRMDYVPDRETGLLAEEYADVYGVPFSVIPFKGRPKQGAAPEDKPFNRVVALPERRAFELRFPVVEGYAFALRHDVIKADVARMERLLIEPSDEPTAVFVQPTVGYQVGDPSALGPGQFVQQDRRAYYDSTHLQAIEFEIARQVVDALVGGASSAPDRSSGPKRRLAARHQLFPQVLRYVLSYVAQKVDFHGAHPCELGLDRYVNQVVSRLLNAIEPDDTQGEAPLLPILNRYKSIGTTAEVDFKTTRPCVFTQFSHLNQVAGDTGTWEQIAAFRLDQAGVSGVVKHYARNDHLGLLIPYDLNGVSYSYEPDFLVRLADGRTIVLEIKGYEPNEA
ncbi:MAG: restriction endonuclease, partial [Chloroflexota bacterium]